MNKYIIALLSLEPEIYANEARKSFANIIDVYVAGSESYPHITICQFYTDENIVQKIDEDLAKIDSFPQPHFNGLHFVKDPASSNLWGAELSVSRKSNIVEFHRNIIQILKDHGVKSITTKIGDLYRPHLTLAIINKLQITHFNEELLKNSRFALTLGKASKIGQYKEVIKTYPAKMMSLK